MGWGYRVYTVETYDNRVVKGAELPVDAIDGQGLATVLECLAAKHLQSVSLRGKPRRGRLGPFNDDAHARRVLEEVNDPKLDPDRLLHIDKVGCLGGVVTVEAESGRVNAHRHARPSTGKTAIDLHDHAATRETRSWFLVPAFGTQALVVAEVNGVSASVSSLISWLQVASGAERAEGRQWRFKISQLVDPKFVEDLLDPDRSAQVTLIKHGDDGSRSTEGAKLQVGVVSEARRTLVGRAVLAVRAKDYDQREVLKDLAGVVSGADHIEFDDATLTVKQDAGGSATLDLFNPEEAFTYRLKGDHRPSASAYLAAAREVVARMPELDGLALPWPDQGD